MDDEPRMMPVIPIDVYPMNPMPHAWDIGFPDMAVTDGHPDILTESDEYGRDIPPGWFVCTAFDERGMSLMIKIARWVHAPPGQGMTLLKSPASALPYEYGESLGLDWTEDFHHYRVLRSRFTHPSREYVMEVARQIASGERGAFRWSHTLWRMVRPSHVDVWEHDTHGTWNFLSELPGYPPVNFTTWEEHRWKTLP